jgi:hypothetical protein
MTEVKLGKKRHINAVEDVLDIHYGDSRMRHVIFGLVAAAALVASIGAANAQGPVKLTDGQLDKATAGATTNASNDTAYLVGISTTDLGRLLAVSNWAVGWLNGVPQPLPSATALTAPMSIP